MSIYSLKVQRTAHYHMLGTPGKHIKRFCIACHGYGQSPERFVQKFRDLVDGETLIVAPEGLSKFYFGGTFTGNVGASWMTKENREAEIEDYVNYLQQIYSLFVPQLDKEVQITLFGFSQGGATISRFAALKKPLFHHIVLWACDFAHDVDFKGNKKFFDSKKMFLVLGDEDQFITPDRLEKYLEFAKEQEIKFEQITFKGKHTIERPVLVELFERF